MSGHGKFSSGAPVPERFGAAPVNQDFEKTFNLNIVTYLLTRVRSRFDTFFTVLLSKAPPISRNDLMPQKRLSYHKLCQQTGIKFKLLSC